MDAKDGPDPLDEIDQLRSRGHDIGEDAPTHYLLDTPFLTAYLLNRPFAVRLISPWIEKREVATSVLIYGEVQRYIREKPEYRQLHAQLLELLQAIPPLGVSYAVMRAYGELRGSRSGRVRALGESDALIAATALSHRLTLVTDEAAFQHLPNLLIMFLPRQYLATDPGSIGRGAPSFALAYVMEAEQPVTAGASGPR